MKILEKKQILKIHRNHQRIIDLLRNLKIFKDQEQNQYRMIYLMPQEENNSIKKEEMDNYKIRIIEAQDKINQWIH